MECGSVTNRGNRTLITRKSLILNMESDSSGAGWTVEAEYPWRPTFTLHLLPQDGPIQPLLCTAPCGCLPSVLKFQEGEWWRKKVSKKTPEETVIWARLRSSKRNLPFLPATCYLAISVWYPSLPPVPQESLEIFVCYLSSLTVQFILSPGAGQSCLCFSTSPLHVPLSICSWSYP